MNIAIKSVNTKGRIQRIAASIATGLVALLSAQAQCEVANLSFNYTGNFGSSIDPAFIPSGASNFLVAQQNGALYLVKPVGPLRGEIGVDFAFQLTNRFCFGADVSVAIPAGRQVAAGIKATTPQGTIQSYFTSVNSVYSTDCGPSSSCGGNLGCNCGGGTLVSGHRLLVQRLDNQIKLFSYAGGSRSLLWAANLPGAATIRLFLVMEGDVPESASCSFENVSVTADGIVSTPGPALTINPAIKLTVKTDYHRFHMIERSLTLETNSWVPYIGPFYGDGLNTTFYDDALPGASRFYRARTVGN